MQVYFKCPKDFKWLNIFTQSSADSMYFSMIVYTVNICCRCPYHTTGNFLNIFRHFIEHLIPPCTARLLVSKHYILWHSVLAIATRTQVLICLIFLCVHWEAVSLAVYMAFWKLTNVRNTACSVIRVLLVAFVCYRQRRTVSWKTLKKTERNMRVNLRKSKSFVKIMVKYSGATQGKKNGCPHYKNSP